MWNHRLLLLLCAIVGVVACFYPMGPGDNSYVAYLLTVPVARVDAAMVVGGTGLATIAALIGIVRPPFGRVPALLALVGFAIAIVPNADHLMDLFKAPLAGKLLGGALLGGGAMALLALIAPEPKRA